MVKTVEVLGRPAAAAAKLRASLLNDCFSMKSSLSEPHKLSLI